MAQLKCPKCRSCVFDVISTLISKVTYTEAGATALGSDFQQNVICRCAECGQDIREIDKALAEEIIDCV